MLDRSADLFLGREHCGSDSGIPGSVDHFHTTWARHSGLKGILPYHGGLSVRFLLEFLCLENGLIAKSIQDVQLKL